MNAALTGDVLKVVFAVLLAVLGYFLRDVALIQKQHVSRLNKHAQRLSKIDGEIESDA